MTQMYTVPESPPPAPNDAIRDALDDWTKQWLIVEEAKKQLNLIEAVLEGLFGDRRDSVWSGDTHIAYQVGNRIYEWQKAAMAADISPERYKLYAKPTKIDWAKMCKNEGVLEEDVPFTRRPGKIKISFSPPEETTDGE